MFRFDKRRKGVFGLQMGKKVIIFIDDLNMLQKEIYGVQFFIELFRQYIDYGYWYVRENINIVKYGYDELLRMGNIFSLYA